LLPNSLNIICLSESRINQKSLSNIDLLNYKILHNDSSTCAGAVVVYVSKNLQVEIISKLCLNIEGCEDMSIKLCQTDILYGVIYRHPKNNIKLFLEEINKKWNNLMQIKFI